MKRQEQNERQALDGAICALGTSVAMLAMLSMDTPGRQKLWNALKRLEMQSRPGKERDTYQALLEQLAELMAAPTLEGEPAS